MCRVIAGNFNLFLKLCATVFQYFSVIKNLVYKKNTNFIPKIRFS